LDAAIAIPSIMMLVSKHVCVSVSRSICQCITVETGIGSLVHDTVIT